MSKSALMDAVRALPDGLQDFLDVMLPDVPGLPGDVDTAIKLQGQLADYLLQLFGAFKGLTLLRVPLHIGQHNEALLGLLLAALEVTGAAAATFDITYPADGQTYTAQINHITAATSYSSEEIQRVGVFVHISTTTQFVTDPEQDLFVELKYDAETSTWTAETLLPPSDMLPWGSPGSGVISNAVYEVTIDAVLKLHTGETKNASVACTVDIPRPE